MSMKSLSRQLWLTAYCQGQSAGAALTDFLNFAYPDNPLVKGFYMDSGSSFLSIGTGPDTTHSNFSFVASQLGCDGLNASAKLTCMRDVPVDKIVNFISRYNATPPISFAPVPDEKLVFSNYTQRYEIGALARLPAIYSTCSNEGSGFIPLPAPGSSVNQTAVNLGTIPLFLCPAEVASEARRKLNLTAYRSQFAGNFSNVSPLPWMGAFHSSDLYFYFGTHQDFRSTSPPFEFAVSQSMQDHLYAFLLDPLEGPRKIGWPTYSSGKMLRFGADGKVVQNVTLQEVEGVCTGNGTYDPFP